MSHFFEDEDSGWPTISSATGFIEPTITSNKRNKKKSMTNGNSTKLVTNGSHKNPWLKSTDHWSAVGEREQEESEVVVRKGKKQSQANQTPKLNKARREVPDIQSRKKPPECPLNSNGTESVASNGTESLKIASSEESNDDSDNKKCAWDDAVMIGAYVHIDSSATPSGAERACRADVPTKKATQRFLKAYKEQSYTDLIIQTGDGKSLQAHKFVFAAISDAFVDMLNKSSKSKGKSFVKMVETKEIVNAILTCAYTDYVPDRVDCFKLLDAGHKYDIPMVYVTAIDRLSMALSKGNAVPAFAALEKYASLGVKAAERALEDAISFISVNYPLIKSQDDFRALPHTARVMFKSLHDVQFSKGSVTPG